jgi:hypothetical protein
MRSSLTKAQKKDKADRARRARALTRAVKKKAAENRIRARNARMRKLHLELNQKVEERKYAYSELFYAQSFGSKSEVQRAKNKLTKVRKNIAQLQRKLNIDPNEFRRRPTTGGLGLTTARGFYSF